MLGNGATAYLIGAVAQHVSKCAWFRAGNQLFLLANQANVTCSFPGKFAKSFCLKSTTQYMLKNFLLFKALFFPHWDVIAFTVHNLLKKLAILGFKYELGDQCLLPNPLQASPRYHHSFRHFDNLASTHGKSTGQKSLSEYNFVITNQTEFSMLYNLNNNGSINLYLFKNILFCKIEKKRYTVSVRRSS